MGLVFSLPQIAIPVLSITLIKKTKTALLVPNALVITTTTEKVSGSFGIWNHVKQHALGIIFDKMSSRVAGFFFF